MPSSLLLTEKQPELILLKIKGSYDLRMKKSVVAEAYIQIGEV